MKIGALLSIREKATRLPGKVLLKIKGQTVTEHLINRIKMAGQIDSIIIATSHDRRDDIFDKLAENKSIDIFHGSKKDKLQRYLDTANFYHLDAVVVIDGDDILCFPEIIEKTAIKLRERQFDAIFWKNLPLGAASSGLMKAALEKAIKLKAENDTEVWGGYFTNSNQFKVCYLEPEVEIFRHPEIRMTLDYIEDFWFIKSVFEELYSKNIYFKSIELMDLLVNKKPELNDITKDAQRKYEQHLKKSAPVKFK